MDEMDKKMNENKKYIQKSIIDEIKKLQTILLKDLPKREVEIQGNHEHKEKHGDEIPSHIWNMLSQLESMNI